FEAFRRRLQREYDATPSPETDARIQAIRARQTPFANAAPAPRPIATPLVPPRRRPWPRVLWPVVAGAVATATIGWLVASGPHRTSVAVLGLGNATRDTTLTYLADGLAQRSEEHTSELQSLAYLVCRLLLEKKKIKTEHAAHR